MLCTIDPIEIEDATENISPWTATYVCTLSDWCGNAAIYKMEPAHCGYDRVVVSAISNGIAHETYIFGLNDKGETNFSELNGSIQGTTSHVQVLSAIGYIVK